MQRFRPWCAVVCIAVLLLAVSPAVLAGDWQPPQCATVTGAPFPTVTFTADEGATLAPLDPPLRGLGYTWSVVPFDVPNKLAAIYNGALMVSTNAGCRWQTLARYNAFLSGTPRLAWAPGDNVYIWFEAGNQLMRLAGSQLVPLNCPVGSVMGFGVDAADVNHVRLASDLGALWDSRDGGLSWTPLGKGVVDTMVYAAVFERGNLDHAVLGTMVHGAFVTTDAGATWTPARGLSPTGGPVNVMSVAMAPSDPQTVFVMGLDIDEADSGSPTEGRHLYRSRDGGLTYVPVVDKSPRITIVNGPVMAVNPGDPDVLYFVFGTSYQNYGTDLFRFDGVTGRVTKTHNAYHRISSLAFNPADPRWMYLGAASEQGVH